MLMVPTELRSSTIHGVGLFLTERVREDDLIWRYDSRIDRVYTRGEIESLPTLLQKFIDVYAPWHEPTGLWVLYNDNAKYINHSKTPVTKCLGPAFGDLLATQNLDPGTELTADYFAICDMTRITGKFSGSF